MDEDYIPRPAGPPNQEARLLWVAIVVLLVVCVVGYNHLQQVKADNQKLIEAKIKSTQQEYADFNGLLQESVQAGVKIDCAGFTTKMDVEQCKLEQQAAKP